MTTLYQAADPYLGSRHTPRIYTVGTYRIQLKDFDFVCNLQRAESQLSVRNPLLISSLSQESGEHLRTFHNFERVNRLF